MVATLIPSRPQGHTDLLGLSLLLRFDASMYFRFGAARRAGVTATSCFDAVVSGERTSTTRFERDSPRQFAAWGSLRRGDIVRIWSGRWRDQGFTGRSCLIEITEPAAPVDLLTLNREAWSHAEGWAPAFVDVLLDRGLRHGLQIRFRLHEAPADPQIQLQF